MSNNLCTNLFLDLLNNKIIQKEFTSEERYNIGYQIANNKNKIYQNTNFGYKSTKFISFVKKLLDLYYDSFFIDGLNDYLNKFYKYYDSNYFVKNILIGKEGYKYFYLVENYIHKENISVIISKSPYINLVTYFKKIEVFKYFNTQKPNFNKDLSSLYNLFIKMGILNNDERIFDWALNIYKLLESKLIILDISLKTITVTSLNRQDIPEKYYLQRLKKLSQLGNLSNIYYDLIPYCKTWKIFDVLTRYYYNENIDSGNMGYGYCFINLLINKNYIDRLNFIKSNYSPNHFLLLKILILNSVQNLEYLKIIPTNIKYIKPFYKYLLANMNKNTKLKFIEKLNYYCCNELDLLHYDIPCKGKLISLLRELYTEYPNLLLKSHPLIISVIRPNYKNIPKEYIKMNKLGTFLKIIMQKKYLTKMKNIKNKLTNLIIELNTYKPNTKKNVLSRGCRYYQIKDTSYSNLSLSTTKVSFLEIKDVISNKYKNITHTKMLSSTKPFKLNNLIKSIFIEETLTYLVYDINLPNMTYLDRIEYLRKINPLSKYYTIPIFTNNNQINEFIKKELAYINQLSNTWYPLPLFFKL